MITVPDREGKPTQVVFDLKIGEDKTEPKRGVYLICAQQSNFNEPTGYALCKDGSIYRLTSIYVTNVHINFDI